MGRAYRTGRGITASLLAGVTAIGCSVPTAQPHASLRVAVVSGPIPGTTFAGGAPNWNTFTVDVVVKNESDVAAHLNPCGPEVEYESPAGEWTEDPRMCAAALGGDIELLPRSERQWRVTRIPPSRTAAASPLRVRLLYRYFTIGVAGSADEVRSEPIELK